METNKDVDTLFEGEWVSIVSPKDHPYESLHEMDSVMVLPIIGDPAEFVIREEVCPPYGIKDKDGNDRYWTLITGKVEDGEDVKETAIRELREEAGYIPDSYSLWLPFRDKPICKSTDKHVSVAVVYFEDYEWEVPQGDGCEYEDMSECKTVSFEEWKRMVDGGRLSPEERRFDFLIKSLFWYIKSRYNTNTNKFHISDQIKPKKDDHGGMNAR
jgi:8-oxo-dGTP pyrophosphatase MutT (NUDIX family)